MPISARVGADADRHRIYPGLPDRSGGIVTALFISVAAEAGA
jgi:hypothetical protein